MPRGSQVLLDYHDRITLDGKEYEIINSHRNYITALKVLRSKDIFDEDKMEALMPLLLKDTVPEGMEQRAVMAFFALFTDKKKKSNSKPSFDIVQDADYIYSAFMQTYGIDLDSSDMSIERFIALLKGLPSDTRLAEIAKIRTMPVPQRTKYNAQQISDILRAKQEFALEDENLDRGLGSFGRMIKEWARHGR